MDDYHAKVSLLKHRFQELELEKNTILEKLKALEFKANNFKNNEFSKEEKLNIFTSLFKGRLDLFAKRWLNLTTGKSGYSPVCSNEWRKNICNKPKIRCSDCLSRAFVPINKEVIIKHLTTDHTIGIYPLLLDQTCYFLAVDFDGKSWQVEAKIFINICNENNISAYLERSRSGNGGHVWIFFEKAISAIDARRFGKILLDQTVRRNSKIKLSSYDRLFPNQDFLPKGGFGNLIALPLQYIPRQENNSVFLDDNFNPYLEQWKFLSTVQKNDKKVINRILKEEKDRYLITVNNNFETIKIQNEICNNQSLPTRISITLANQLFINKLELPNILMNKLIELGNFHNPEFYKAEAID